MAAKDMLRGLRHELERLKDARPVASGLAPLPAEALHGFFETIDKIASAGEHLARDLLFSKRDQSRYADFFDPRAALAGDADAGHRFVRSRYAALKLVMAALRAEAALISESKIATALSSLPHSVDDTPTEFEAHFTLALAREAPIAIAKHHDGQNIEINRLAALIIGLAGTVAAQENARDAQDLPDLIALCIDVVRLRQSRLIPIFDGPTPEAILAPVFDELADALRDF
jgi:hypothetical protein